MKLNDILNGLTILETTADLNADITDVCYDSRQAVEGGLFVAIAGAATDGHRYIPMVQEKGAACVVCQQVPDCGIPYVLVEDSRRALAVIACNWFDHPSREMTMVGVTGTSGKTTSTYLIKSILEQKAGAKVGLIGTIQNMIGSEVLHTERTTPESFELQKLLRRMSDAGCTHAVMEVSSHALVLDRVYGIRFAVGILPISVRIIWISTAPWRNIVTPRLFCLTAATSACIMPMIRGIPVCCKTPNAPGNSPTPSTPTRI